MIAIANSEGNLVKRLHPPAAGAIYGFHRLFGFISEADAIGRARNRKLHHLSLKHNEWICRFHVTPTSDGWRAKALEGCTVSADSVQFQGKTFYFSEQSTANLHVIAPTPEPDSQTWKASVLLASLVFGLFFLIPQPVEESEPEIEILEQVTVKVMPEKRQQRSVRVPASLAKALPEMAKQLKSTGGKGGAAQNLGFLGMLGDKNLKSALGGMPSKLKNASPGAGAGGKQGSGGELLVGLGQGVKRTTVGNSGVEGLGGIGTKGAGGGAGGYGNSLIGSGTGAGVGRGDGRALSALPLGDEMILEGGLDSSVIQATIAKYLYQVRACYETGLRTNPGLSGQVAMAFEINGTGELNYANVKKSSLGNLGVEKCISKRMLDWKFPRPVGGVKVKVAYPFLLRPVNS